MQQERKWIRYVVCFGLVLVIVAIYVLRLAQWQLVDGEMYSSISDSSSNLFVKLNAARGEILDKNGESLAGNKTVYNVVMNAITMDYDRNPAILGTIRVLEEDNVKWIDKLPIVLNTAGEFEFISGKESEIEKLKSADMLNMQEYATAEECMTALISRYNCTDYSREDARDIISVRYNMTKLQFSRSEPHVIAEDVPMATIQKISEYSSDLPGIEVRVTTERDYTEGTIAPHIIGTLGSISQEQYDMYQAAGNTYSSDNFSGYSYTESVGQSGIESAYESYLRGVNGKEKIITDSHGDIVSSEIVETPTSGNSVYLTIDKDLQKVANESLAINVQAAAQNAEDCIAGAVVVLDIETFGILAASSYPSYDLGLYSDDDTYYNNLLEDETRPLFNRAFDGIFTPGSVFKPMVALAALEEGVINVGSAPVNCTGVYDYYQDGNPPTCLGVHGYVNVIEALQVSCNSFFYDVGRVLTINKMDVYADLFSFGKRTGIEISEASGIMSSPEEYLYNHGTQWIDGLTIQTAIGQCDTMLTPLQIATYCATIANGGVRLKTHLLDRVMDYDGETVINAYEPEVMETIDVAPQNLKYVQEAMSTVSAEGGTANYIFGDYGIKIASKTGTAENPGHSDNVVFMAYAPYDNPQIAVAVVIEYGKRGSFPQSVAKDIFDQYFYGEVTTDYSLNDDYKFLENINPLTTDNFAVTDETQQSTSSSQDVTSSSQSETSADSSLESKENEDTEPSRGSDIPDF